MDRTQLIELTKQLSADLSNGDAFWLEDDDEASASVDLVLGRDAIDHPQKIYRSVELSPIWVVPYVVDGAAAFKAFSSEDEADAFFESLKNQECS